MRERKKKREKEATTTTTTMNSMPVNPLQKLPPSKPSTRALSRWRRREKAAFYLLTWWNTGLVAQSLASSGRIASIDGAAVVAAAPSTPLPLTTPSHDASSLLNDTSRKRPLDGGGSSGSVVVVALMARARAKRRKKKGEVEERKKNYQDNGRRTEWGSSSRR